MDVMDSSGFGWAHPVSAKREEAILLLEEIESALDDSSEADTVRLELQKLKRDYDLSEPKPGLVERFVDFSHAVGCVRYAALNAVQEEPVDLSMSNQQEPIAAITAENLAPVPTTANDNGQSAVGAATA